MTEHAQSDVHKILDALRSIRKTLQCTSCKKLPTDATAPKCGHLFCGSCIEQILHTKKAACSICKTFITNSYVRKIKDIDKTIRDVETLTAAISQDLGNPRILLDQSADEPKMVQQYRGKRQSIEAQPSTSKESIFSNESLIRKSQRTYRRTSNTANKFLRRRTPSDSGETIKIHRVKLTDENAKQGGSEHGTTSKASDNSSEIFCPTAEKLADKVEMLEPNKKVDLWLSSEKFETENQISYDFPENMQSIAIANSTIITENQDYSGIEENENVENEGLKYKSFTRETRNKSQSLNSKAVTPAEKMFDELCGKKTGSEKSAIISASTRNSWSKLAEFKKETRSKVRKRRRLDISIGKSGTVKQAIDDKEDSKEEQVLDSTDSPVRDNGEKSATSSAEKCVNQSSAEKKLMPSIVSSRRLEKDEMINIPSLNRREVKEIIGAAITESDLDQSKNSNISPDKLSLKSTNAQLALSKSNEHNQDTSNETVPADAEKSSQLGNSRPVSRVSINSPVKPVSEKFNLSLNRRSLTPNISPLKISPNQDAEAEKIVFLKDSPVKACNDYIKNKLSLSKSSPRIDKKLVGIKKLGRLSKSRSRIKFLKLGPIKSRPVAKESQNTSSPILTCNVQTQVSPKKISLSDAQTQTSSELTNSNYIRDNRHKKMVSNEPLNDARISDTCRSSVASSDLGKTKALQASSSNSVGRTTDLSKSKKELDIIDKVNMLSPGKDSQLKYLATESPLIARVGSLVNNHSEDTEELSELEKGSNSSKYMKEVKSYAEKLIATDSEDPDMPNEIFSRNKRKNDHRTDVNSSNKESTTDIVSTSKVCGQINVAGSQHLINMTKPVSINSERELSYASPKQKRLSRDLFDSQKKKNLQAEASAGNYADCYTSDAEIIPPRQTTSKKNSQFSQDSETSITNSKHKVVRKLQYSQESPLSPNAELRKSGSSSHRATSEEHKKLDSSSGKKNIQRKHSVYSTDSDDELMEISLSTKPSSCSNSRKTLRPSQATIESLLPEEEMSIGFSSNKDPSEPKRKRSLSASSLDNIDLYAIASNWCADLNRSSEEIAVESAKVLEKSSRHAVKKAKFEERDSSASNSDDDFPRLNANAMYCRTEPINTKSHSNLAKTKNCDSVDLVEKERNSHPSSSATSLISNKNKESSSTVRVERINAFNYEEVNNTVTRNNSRCSTPPENMKLGDTLYGLITPDKNLTPVKTRTSQLTNNSNKENEVGDLQARSRVGRRATTSGNVENKSPSSGDLSKFVQAENQQISNNVSLSNKGKSANNITPFDSCSDQDFLNITQEQMLLQEVENNLLGQNSNGVNKRISQINRAEDDAETTLIAEKPIANKVIGKTGKGDAITKPDSDDSITIEEDIVENTPQKNFPPKKEMLHPYADCSQRSTMSRRSFMSVDVTPIPKTSAKHLRGVSGSSPLVDLNSSRISIPQRSNSSAGSIHPSYHSTPKPNVPKSHRVNHLAQTTDVEKKKRRLCFISSCLPAVKVDELKAFARLRGAEFTANYKPEVTHVIVEADESNSASRTVKYLLGIAHKKWIVSYQWVADSISQGRLLEEEKYEVVDSDTHDPGARRSRLSEQGLFEDFAFVCTNPITQITASQMKDLITSTGGVMAESLKELASAKRKYKIVVYNSDETDKKKLENLRQRGGVLPAPFEWVWTCISQYKLTSLSPYVEPEDLELALELKFPEELVVDVDESDNGNEESGSDVDQ